MAEVVVYREGKVLVSSARVSIGQATYALSDVSSVHIRYTLPFAGAGMVSLLAGAAVLWFAFSTSDKLALAAGIGALVTGVWLRFLLRHFHLVFNTGARQMRVLSTYSRSYVEELAFAVKKAIVTRG
ncbi:MAG: DUF6232 family protein [bacterium]|nr:DUF6232 family protein [bacterium]